MNTEPTYTKRDNAPVNEGGSDAEPQTLYWLGGNPGHLRKAKAPGGQDTVFGYPSLYIKLRRILAHDSPAVINVINLNNASVWE